jgi:hypothetical protein
LESTRIRILFFKNVVRKHSYPVFHDPRPGAMMSKLPQKDGAKITMANEAIHYKINPGTMM